MDTETDVKTPGWRRAVWFVAIYAGSVLAVGALVYGLKAAFGGLLG
jgi:hypothetical protein